MHNGDRKIPQKIRKAILITSKRRCIETLNHGVHLIFRAIFIFFGITKNLF